MSKKIFKMRNGILLFGILMTAMSASEPEVTFSKAKVQSEQQKKPILVNFYTDW